MRILRKMQKDTSVQFHLSLSKRGRVFIHICTPRISYKTLYLILYLKFKNESMCADALYLYIIFLKLRTLLFVL